jgi:hypothetical protein
VVLIVDKIVEIEIDEDVLIFVTVFYAFCYLDAVLIDGVGVGPVGLYAVG